MNKTTCKILIFAAAAALTLSCMKSPRYLSLQEETDGGYATQQQQQKGRVQKHTHIITDETQILVVADSIVTNAENLTLNGKHDEAQKLIRVLFEIFTIPEEDCEVTDALLSRIARLYVEKLPPKFIDSIPSSITAFVTLYQFQLIMNEMDTVTIDMSKFPINCVRDVHFNVPIEYNKRVQRAMITLLAAHRRERMELLLNRSLYYRPFMMQMYEEAGLPTDITLLPLLESAFNPRAYSKAHASGLWQFIPSTGRIFGLRENYWVDERRDPIKSTAASIAYFTRLYNMFGDWYLALASYNCGEGRVGRHLRNAREINPDTVVTYWDLNLPKETMNYVPLYIAYQIIGRNPRCFGFFPDSSIVAFPYDTVKVSESIDMARIAAAVGISHDSLRRINPHIKQFATPPDLKNVILYLPPGTKDAYKNFHASLGPQDKIRWYRYQVVSGDNLNSVAKRFGLTAQAIKDMNQMKSNTLAVGRHILLPLPDNEATAERVRRAQEEERRAAEAAAARRAQLLKATDGSGKVSYRVSSGETLYSIAKLYNVSVNDVIAWNPNINPRFLRVGDNVTIYTATPNATAQQTTANAPQQTATATAASAPTNTDAAATATTGRQTGANRPANSEEAKYTVRSGDNLYQISRRINVSLSDLIAWNGKDVDNPMIRPGETLIYYRPVANQPTSSAQPAAASAAAQPLTAAPTPATAQDETVITYRVKSGDTFFSIARIFSTTVADLENLNGFKASELKAGQMIRVRDNTPTSAPQPTAAVTATAQPTTAATATRHTAGSETTLISYKVQSGDYLYKLASRFNVSVQEISIANNFPHDRKLRAGEVIKIPSKN